MATLFSAFYSTSTVPATKKEEYVIPIEKTIWKHPSIKKKEGEGGREQEKSQEELELDREAAEAVLKGK